MQSDEMKVGKLSIFLAGIWCTFCLCVSLVGGAVALLCNSPDIPQCGYSGFDAGRQWSKIAPFAITVFAAGAFYAFRMLRADIKIILARVMRRS